jgi:hypothetical protein
MQISPASSDLPLTTKYFPQYPVLKHSQSMFFPRCEEPSLTPIQNNTQHLSFHMDPIVHLCTTVFNKSHDNMSKLTWA